MALVRAIYLLYGPPASPGLLEEEAEGPHGVVWASQSKKKEWIGLNGNSSKGQLRNSASPPVPTGEVEREGLVRPGVQDAGAPGNLVLRAAVHHQGHGGLAQNGQEGWDQIPLGGCAGWQEGIYLPLPLGT